ncbi:hypothetical protein V5D56_19990 [Cellulosimicrobium sp. PMB13]|uniref:hypothetical protein n=1 Tax=Cellulosimicrobium sp. PMB13 TaxID=3120158 RepID=UPI003F4C8EEC
MLRTTATRGLPRGATRTSVVPATGPFLGPGVLLLTLAAALLTNLADRGFAVVHQCVTVPGAWGIAGMHLALVHETPDCPSGTALGGDGAAMVTVLGVLAVPVLLGHAVAALVAWGVSARVRRAHTRARELSAGAVRVLTALLAHVLGASQGRRVAGPRAQRLPRPDVVPAALHHLADAVVRTRRGPPVAALA